MPELMESPRVDRLGLEHRNLLQAAVIRKILGANASNAEKVEWMMNNGEKISDLIDHHEHDEIRALAEEGNYDEAAEMLIKLLESSE